ncbi:MAG: hypothetical protein JST55_16530 [Bacteroidetes bacterium]|nr:hypothetical protein [Bacteroidota bacterium]
MNTALTITFFEDYFICSINPNENLWEILQINGTDKNLLYFYLSSNKIINDDSAKERYEANDKMVFGNFYDLISNNKKTFNRFDYEWSSIDLLSDILEQIKMNFRNRMSVFSDFDEDTKILLNISFVPGIDYKVKEIIKNYFENNDFVVREIDYYEAFLAILVKKGMIPNKVNLSLVETYFGDLYLNYIEYSNQILKKQSEVLIGKGVDHRVGDLSRLLVVTAAKKVYSRILGDEMLLENEIKKFHVKARSYLNDFYYNELDKIIELTDSPSTRVIIDLRDLENMSSATFLFIKNKFELFISKYSNLARTEKIILNGDVLSSKEFVLFFEKNYGASKVVKPYSNFSQLLSKGIFEIAPKTEYQAGSDTSSTEIEIKIKVSSGSKETETIVSIPAMPPLPKTIKTDNSKNPRIAPPPLPNNIKAVKDLKSNSVKKILPPPLNIPKKEEKVISNNEIKKVVNKIPTVPPLPSSVKKK